jgi:peptidylprolyl isomerase
MASGPANNSTPAGDSDRAKMLRVLIPTGVVLAIIVVVAVVAGLADAGGRAMSDGSDGTANDPELKELKPGVKYRDLKEGTGDPCPPGTSVKMKYTGWLTDGSVFDSTKGKPAAEFMLEDLIPGWQAGIPGMKVGGIRKLVISPEMGYRMDRKPGIPPGSTLIFEVELLSFRPPMGQPHMGAGNPNRNVV